MLQERVKIDGIVWKYSSLWKGTGNYKCIFNVNVAYPIFPGDNLIMRCQFYPATASQNYTGMLIKNFANNEDIKSWKVDNTEVAQLQMTTSSLYNNKPYNWFNYARLYTLGHNYIGDELFDAKAPIMMTQTRPPYAFGVQELWFKGANVMGDDVSGKISTMNLYGSWTASKQAITNLGLLVNPKGGDYNVNIQTNSGAVIEDNTDFGFRQIFVSLDSKSNKTAYSTKIAVSINDADVVSLLGIAQSENASHAPGTLVSQNSGASWVSAINTKVVATYDPAAIHYFVGKRADGTYTKPLIIRYSCAPTGEDTNQINTAIL